MANTKSAIKMIRVSERKRQRNQPIRSEVKTLVKNTRKDIDAGHLDAAREEHPPGGERRGQGREQGRRPQERRREAQVPPHEEAGEGGEELRDGELASLVAPGYRDQPVRVRWNTSPPGLESQIRPEGLFPVRPCHPRVPAPLAVLPA